LTPTTTTVPSIIEERSFFPSPPFSCFDFAGKSRGNIWINCDHGYEGVVKDLVANISSNGYSKSPVAAFGVQSALEAIQKGLSFHQRAWAPMPLTITQLRTNLWRVRQAQGLPHNEFVTPRELRDVLDLCSEPAQCPFHLGVLLASNSERHYNTTILPSSSPFVHATIWMFQDRSLGERGLPEQWSAIIQKDFGSPTISYAAALMNQPSGRSRPTRTTANTHLSPSTVHRTSYSNSVRQAPYSVPMARTLSGSSSHQRHRRLSDESRRMSHQNTLESRSGHPCQHCLRIFNTRSDLRHHLRSHGPKEKPHKCKSCPSAFQYPKDLTRHEDTHNKQNKFTCPICSKVYTRKDNLQRHQQNDHKNHTPPPSLPAG
jgi:hypothetical protein